MMNAFVTMEKISNFSIGRMSFQITAVAINRNRDY